MPAVVQTLRRGLPILDLDVPLALNVAISFFREESRKSRTFVPAEDSILELAIAPAGSPSIEDDLRVLWQAIDGLDALDRALVVLYLDGQAHEAIADGARHLADEHRHQDNRIKKRLRRDMSRAV